MMTIAPRAAAGRSWDDTPNTHGMAWAVEGAGRGGAGVPGAPHRSVMLTEVMAALHPAAGEVFIDGTFGAGGYTRAILEAGASVVAIDRDPDAIARGATLKGEAEGRLVIVKGLFGDLDRHAEEAGHTAVDGVVLDVGVSSPQLDTPERGFSFRLDGPLDMRMGGDGPSAADVIASASERDLAWIVRTLGEERHARRVARAIIAGRTAEPITTTGELARIVARVVPKSADGIHPATRTFQAIRLYVNSELEELGRALEAAERILKAGGRLVVVAFHSLEDRIVKRFLADRAGTGAGGSRHLPVSDRPAPTFVQSVRKALAPSGAEVATNPRARSARVRQAVRTDAPARPVDLAAIGVPSLALAGGAR